MGIRIPTAPACPGGRGSIRQGLLIIPGLPVFAAGQFRPWFAGTPSGRRPGDIHTHRAGFDFFPITTGLLIVLVPCLLIWLFRR
ncbi:DUF2905 domain-containing protein [Aromatoleum toluclasticum]|uniref:DUF2905 domain-containing protein n=1 Tax=Aromatoleum toluclasticum TaxID=92003 RepID=UPI001D196528|nr:DUF2905 domain-containing protein [Aromatoleum toluclasticum]MCC4116924.1 DUF2905 domain-containing protein [Aromatoleum toluclasticum]